MNRMTYADAANPRQVHFQCPLTTNSLYFLTRHFDRLQADVLCRRVEVVLRSQQVEDLVQNSLHCCDTSLNGA